MSRGFSLLPIVKIVKETANSSTIYFKKPDGESFDYLPGQYLTLKVTVNGEELRRAYSLCSSPFTDENLAVTVKRVEKGKVSNYLIDQLKVGDSLEVMPPMGNFKVTLSTNQHKHYVLIGAGSGITPLMSILKSVLRQEENSKVTLLYGNRNQESIIFEEKLKVLGKEYSNRLRVIHSLSQPHEGWTGLSGRLDRHKLLSLAQEIISIDPLPKSFYLCGPVDMMEEAQAALSFLGVSKQHIHRESFTAPLPTEGSGEGKKGTTVAKGTGVYSVSVSIDGEQKHIEVKPGQTILEAVMDAEMDPPYACQAGVCCTCRALVRKGVVEMEEDEGLSDQEIEEGYVLTCQAHPLSEDVELEYM